MPDPGADGDPAGTATNKTGVYDTDPAWIPNGAVLAFTRVVGDIAEIQYVVPGVGQQPDGARDAGITVKDPLAGHPASGVREHAPAWLNPDNILFARTGQCAPGRGCAEDIMQSRLTWTGDYIQDATEPASISSGWSDIRHLSVDQAGDRILVTGRNEQAGGELGVWIRDASDTRTLLAGSVGVTYAIFGYNGTIVGLIGGNEAGWGPVVATWPSLDATGPQFIDAFAVLGNFAGTGSVPSAATAEFGWLSVAPDESGRYAVLISDRRGDPDVRSRPLVIGLLGPDLFMRELVAPRAPTGTPRVVWNELVALAW